MPGCPQRPTHFRPKPPAPGLCWRPTWWRCATPKAGRRKRWLLNAGFTEPVSRMWSGRPGTSRWTTSSASRSRSVLRRMSCCWAPLSGSLLNKGQPIFPQAGGRFASVSARCSGPSAAGPLKAFVVQFDPLPHTRAQCHGFCTYLFGLLLPRDRFPRHAQHWWGRAVGPGAGGRSAAAVVFPGRASMGCRSDQCAASGAVLLIAITENRKAGPGCPPKFFGVRHHRAPTQTTAGTNPVRTAAGCGPDVASCWPTDSAREISPQACVPAD